MCWFKALSFFAPLYVRLRSSCFNLLWAQKSPQYIIFTLSPGIKNASTFGQTVTSASIVAHKLTAGHGWSVCFVFVLPYLQHPGFSWQQIWDKSAFCNGALHWQRMAVQTAARRVSSITKDNRGGKVTIIASVPALSSSFPFSGCQPSSPWLNYTGPGVTGPDLDPAAG